MRVGYARVSSGDQSTDVQRDQLTAAGCERIYEETASGKSADERPELQAVLGFVREGDTLVVCKLDRLARNTLDMLTTITDLGKRGVKFTSIAEPWANTDSPAAELMLTLMAGVATFERARIRERQREGITRKVSTGKRYHNRPRAPKFDPETIRRKHAEGMGPAAIARALECSEMTVFRAMKGSHDRPVAIFRSVATWNDNT